MGLFDKLKNALFEVEYVEVDEPPKSEKENKVKENKFKDSLLKSKKDEVNDKPVAKKIVLPDKKDEKVEKLEEEELIDDNFESRPVVDNVKEDVKESVKNIVNDDSSFNYMEDKDFVVEEDEEYSNHVPEIVKIIETEEDVPKSVKREDTLRRYSFEEPVKEKDDNFASRYGINKSTTQPRESKPYGLDKSLSVQVHEYGTYERKEDKSNFKPSPIISPIYGILDKNYKKEDVVQKKDIKLSSSYSRNSLNVDDIRNKAYGEVEDAKHASIEVDEKPVTTFEVDEEDEEDNLLVDLSDERDKPEVKEITMGDALEYFQDLGLEYNVDYVDASKENNSSYTVKEEVNNNELEEVIEEKMDESLDDVSDLDVITSVDTELENKTKTVEIKNESKDSPEVTLDDDDNLFDLIDSMYQEND